MAIEAQKNNDEATIQELLNNCIRALHDRNIEGIMSLYEQEVVTFDLVPPCATWEQTYSATFGKRCFRPIEVLLTTKCTTALSLWAMILPSFTASTG